MTSQRISRSLQVSSAQLPPMSGAHGPRKPVGRCREAGAHPLRGPEGQLCSPRPCSQPCSFGPVASCPCARAALCGGERLPQGSCLRLPGLPCAGPAAASRARGGRAQAPVFLHACTRTLPRGSGGKATCSPGTQTQVRAGLLASSRLQLTWGPERGSSVGRRRGQVWPGGRLRLLGGLGEPRPGGSKVPGVECRPVWCDQTYLGLKGCAARA